MIADPSLLATSLSSEGWAALLRLVSLDDSLQVQAKWVTPALFRNEANMARQGFGRGVYRSFADLLPPNVAALRAGL
jgi:hypothetical protein